jgi:hypothetical protein
MQTAFNRPTRTAHKLLRTASDSIYASFFKICKAHKAFNIRLVCNYNHQIRPLFFGNNASAIYITKRLTVTTNITT